jgi:hypothetical protein
MADGSADEPVRSGTLRKQVHQMGLDRYGEVVGLGRQGRPGYGRGDTCESHISLRGTGGGSGDECHQARPGRVVPVRTRPTGGCMAFVCEVQ